jgi:hypothetical protein
MDSITEVRAHLAWRRSAICPKVAGILRMPPGGPAVRESQRFEPDRPSRSFPSPLRWRLRQSEQAMSFGRVWRRLRRAGGVNLPRVSSRGSVRTTVRSASRLARQLARACCWPYSRHHAPRDGSEQQERYLQSRLGSLTTEREVYCTLSFSSRPAVRASVLLAVQQPSRSA